MASLSLRSGLRKNVSQRSHLLSFTKSLQVQGHPDCITMWSMEGNTFGSRLSGIPARVPEWVLPCGVQPDPLSCRVTAPRLLPPPAKCTKAQRRLPVHCGQQESWVRAGFWQSSGGHTSVSHSTRPPWHVHWVQESMFHVSPSTKYSPPGAWQMEGVLSSGFCTTKSSGE